MYQLDFNTSYNQFYISDKGFDGDTAEGFWSEEAYNDMLAVGDGILGVGTGSYGHIVAELFILNEASNESNLEKYDHVVEGSITIRSGILEITDCPNNQVELKIEVNPGNYRVRIYATDLDKADHDLYEGNDSYKIEIWPATYADRKVLKRYNW